MKSPPSETMTATAFTHSLADRFFASRTTVGQDEALGQLLDCIANASAELTEIFEYGYDRNEFERVVRKRLGLASFYQIADVVAAIKKPIEEDDSRRSKASPIKSQAAGDNVKEDDIYFGVVMPALSLFFNLRDSSPNLMTGRDIRSGRVTTSKEQGAIKGLRSLPSGLQDWAKLIARLTLSGKYWSRDSALKPGGKIYDAVAGSAVRNRRGKAIKAFMKRYAKLGNGPPRGVSPHEFIGLSLSTKLQIIDLSARAGREPLDNAKVARVTRRAEKIESLTPTARELRRELISVVTDRLRTVPRNRPQVA